MVSLPLDIKQAHGDKHVTVVSKERSRTVEQKKVKRKSDDLPNYKCIYIPKIKTDCIWVNLREALA